MEELEPSRSARKRDAERLQAIGRRLTLLKPEQLDELPLPDALRSAILDYQRFPSHGARRRQLQLIGKRMREIDPHPIIDALETLEGRSVEARVEVRRLETWRERLLDADDPEALTDYLAQHPHADRQALRHHVQQVQRARDERARRIAARALFRFLREADQPA